jgi:hypothetical protein
MLLVQIILCTGSSYQVVSYSWFIKEGAILSRI